MTQCAVIDANGFIVASAANPCTGVVLLTPVEYGLLNNSPLNLSLEDGSVLAVGIVAVWATAFAVRAVIRALGSDGAVTE